MTSTEIRFFWLSLSTMKCSEAPFTHICEWKRCSPSSSYFGSLGWNLVVVTVALVSASMICFQLSRFDSKLEYASNSESFSLATSDCLKPHSLVLCQGILWYSHYFPMSFSDFSLPFLGCGLDRFPWERPYFIYPFFCGLGPPFPCFGCEEFANPNSHLFCLNLCSILISYL